MWQLSSQSKYSTIDRIEKGIESWRQKQLVDFTSKLTFKQVSWFHSVFVRWQTRQHFKFLINLINTFIVAEFQRKYVEHINTSNTNIEGHVYGAG